MSEQDNPYAPQAGAGGQMNYATTTATPSASFDNPAAVQQAASAETIIDVTTETFMSEVLDGSMDRPVIVDFWAPWCGPCKQLGPIIEKVVSEAKGAVRLAKMDIEKYPDIAGQMGIQSIPAVVAFIDGRPADAFMGAKPEGEVKAFVDKVSAKKPAPEIVDMKATVAEADALVGAQDHAAAAELYSAVLAKEPGNLDALAGLGQCYVAVGEIDMAQQLVDSVPEDQRMGDAINGLIKALELKQQGADLGDLEPLAAAVEADAKDHQARFDYAVALNAHDKREEATDQLLHIVKADRKWNDDGARAQLVEFFEAWGNADPATMNGRRALSSVLFS